MKKILRNCIAIILITAGVISGFLPFLQGWMFILAGYIVLDFEKKEQFERKIILLLEKNRLGSKLAALWKRAKSFNDRLMKGHDKDKIRDIFKEIKKDIK